MASSSSSSFSINQEALAKYRRMSDFNNSYSLEDELDHTESLHDSCSSFNASFSSLNYPPAATSKYCGKSATAEKSLKEKSPESVDRGLRIQEWVGGHSPYGVQKQRRSYKLKNPSDEIYLKK
eukprot:CAMPEP_0113640096 /NCGR_PEP_ID=MMETSP0017_2-20120614/21040_1 /TAXON_ID=2856 /ORGANISM="Cylindrotheca closterium" /LENGTH=122 /DNA_ID=CAMNT_0000551353 /DNA_START=875 /DNA_END=1243 /DNA_ORIENTATION=+ /assembly_acc=CAM_ASM_000147